MNKLVKVVSILLIAMMMVATFSSVAFATEAKDAIEGFVGDAGYTSDKISGVQSTAQNILVAIRNVSIIVAVIMISILGVKYMIGSAEEKAGYKKAFMPLIVGAFLVVAAEQIAIMLFSIGK